MRSNRIDRQQRGRRHPAGFTLIEVLLVLAIIGVMMAITVPMLLGRQKQAYIDATKASIGGLENALKLYAADHDGEFPPSSAGLEVLLISPGNDSKWKGPYLEKAKLPADAWGQPLQYQYPGQHQQTQPDIWSFGPDKQPSTEDDINNWTISS